MATKAGTLTAPTPAVENEREIIFDIFRRWGYLQASLDPLGQYLPPEPFPITTVPEGEFAAEARRFYCGNFATPPPPE
jgi:2-oxoglutarate dehydrogenase E1 component